MPLFWQYVIGAFLFFIVIPYATLMAKGLFAVYQMKKELDNTDYSELK